MAEMIAGFLHVLFWIVIGDALLSWFVRPDAFPRTVTSRLLAPIYAPIHKIINPRKTGGMDFSPIIIILLIQFARSQLLGGAV